MQRMGGGKHSGGGNNPSCGCDMQAGWPPASELPRGGLQGGGNWNFNEFNLALTKNGKTKHLRGKWNNGNMNSKKNNNNNNSKKNNTNNNSKKNNKKRPTTSAPPNLKNLMYQGKLYKTDPVSGNTYENGEYVGKYIRPNAGTPYLDTSATPKTPNYPPITPKTPNYPPKTPKTPNYPPMTPPIQENNYENTNEGSSEEYDTEEGNVKKVPKVLSMNGGRRRTRKHGKRCPCLVCTFKRLKMAGGRR